MSQSTGHTIPYSKILDFRTGQVFENTATISTYFEKKSDFFSVISFFSSFVLQFASRRFLDQLLGPGEDRARANRQLKDAEFGNKDIGNLQVLGQNWKFWV